jgi:hypothetical protein
MVVFLVVASLALTTPPGPHRQFALLLLGVSVILRQLSFLLDFQSLPAVLRRSLGDARLSFLIVGAADLTTLILSFAAFSAWSAGEHVQLADLRAAGTNTLLLAKLWPALTTGAAITWLELLSSIAGALFILNGFKSLAKYQDFFTTTTEDVHVIARNHMVLGNFREARKALNSIRPPKREPETYELFALLELATDHLDEAQHAAMNCVDEMKLEPSVRESEALWILVRCVLSLSIERERKLRYLGHWIATVPHDLYLAVGVEGFIHQTYLVIQAEYTDEKDRATQDQLFFAQLEKVISPGEVRKRHALSYAVALMFLELHAPAQDVLRAYEPVTPAEELFRMSLLYLSLIRNAMLTNPRAPVEPIRETLREMETTHAATLAEKAKVVKTDDERLSVIERLYIVCDHAEVIECPHTAHLAQLARVLSDDLGGIPRIDQLFRAYQGMRPRRKETLRAHLEQLRQRAAVTPSTPPSATAPTENAPPTTAP